MEWQTCIDILHFHTLRNYKTGKSLKCGKNQQRVYIRIRYVVFYSKFNFKDLQDQQTSLNSLQRDFTIATDLKLCNVLLGLQNHSSMHPCCWCNIDKNNLHQVGTQRTFKSLSDLFWTYFRAGRKKAESKKYGNAIHLSIIGDLDDTTPYYYVSSSS